MSDTNPYRAPSAEVADVPEGGVELAGRGHRFGAFMIDCLVLAAILGPLYATGVLDAIPDPEESLGASLISAALGFTVFAILQSWFLKRSAQTIGKKVVGIRMMDLAGNPAGLGRLLGRRYSFMYLVNLLPGAWALLGAVDFLLIFRADRRCIHDLFAGTKVVMHGAKHSSATWFIAPLATAAALIAGAMVVDPMFDNGDEHAPPRKAAPRSAPAHAASAVPAARSDVREPATAIPPPATRNASQAPPDAPRVANASVANAPAAAQPSDAELRKCAALKDPAAVIRCSQGGR